MPEFEIGKSFKSNDDLPEEQSLFERIGYGITTSSLGIGIIKGREYLDSAYFHNFQNSITFKYNDLTDHIDFKHIPKSPSCNALGRIYLNRFSPAQSVLTEAQTKLPYLTKPLKAIETAKIGILFRSRELGLSFPLNVHSTKMITADAWLNGTTAAENIIANRTIYEAKQSVLRIESGLSQVAPSQIGKWKALSSNLNSLAYMEGRASLLQSSLERCENMILDPVHEAQKTGMYKKGLTPLAFTIASNLAVDYIGSAIAQKYTGEESSATKFFDTNLCELGLSSLGTTLGKNFKSKIILGIGGYVAGKAFNYLR